MMSFPSSGDGVQGCGLDLLTGIRGKGCRSLGAEVLLGHAGTAVSQDRSHGAFGTLLSLQMPSCFPHRAPLHTYQSSQSSTAEKPGMCVIGGSTPFLISSALLSLLVVTAKSPCRDIRLALQPPGPPGQVCPPGMASSCPAQGRLHQSCPPRGSRDDLPSPSESSPGCRRHPCCMWETLPEGT